MPRPALSHPSMARQIILPLRRPHTTTSSTQCMHRTTARHLSTTSPLSRHKRVPNHPLSPSANYAKMLKTEMLYSHRNPRNKENLKSLRTHSRDMGELNKIPGDLGLFPGTFIPPTGSNKPSLFASPNLALQMEGMRLWKRIRDFISVMSYKFIGNTKPRRKIHFLKTPSIAKALHQQLYTALAAGDSPVISNITLEGLKASLRAKIANRPTGWTYSWTLHKYTGLTRVVSHRATMLPVGDSNKNRAFLRQAVVRLTSVQSLEVRDKSGRVVEGESVEGAKVREYIVIQKRVLRGVDEGWKVWGTVEESAVRDWDDLEALRKPAEEQADTVYA